jgi:hypothetical protein
VSLHTRAKSPVSEKLRGNLPDTLRSHSFPKESSTAAKAANI